MTLTAEEQKRFDMCYKDLHSAMEVYDINDVLPAMCVLMGQKIAQCEFGTTRFLQSLMNEIIKEQDAMRRRGGTPIA